MTSCKVCSRRPIVSPSQVDGLPLQRLMTKTWRNLKTFVPTAGVFIIHISICEPGPQVCLEGICLISALRQLCARVLCFHTYQCFSGRFIVWLTVCCERNSRTCFISGKNRKITKLVL